MKNDKQVLCYEIEIPRFEELLASPHFQYIAGSSLLEQYRHALAEAKRYRFLRLKQEAMAS
jgi:hypothetical protein